LTLPHRFPFRFVDRVADGRGVVRLSAGSTWSRGTGGPAVLWLVEAVAQCAAELLSPPSPPAADGRDVAPGAGPLVLAAVEGAHLEPPPCDGESLEIEVRLEARWGGLIRVLGVVRGDRGTSGEVRLVLSRR
jgi:hypothetical protein